MSLVTRLSHSRRNVDEESPYWLSLSDIMSGLLILFILASLSLMLQLHKKMDVGKERNKVRTEILYEIKAHLKKNHIQVEVVDNDSVLRIPARELHFRQGRHEIPESKTLIVNQIGKSIYEAITKSKRIKLIDTIFIEGHTDSIPAENLYEGGNWELSARRAIVVWEYWRSNPEYGRQLVLLLNSKGDPIFSVSGYADTRRIDKKEKDAHGREENRRIDIRFTMRQPDYISVSDVQKQLQ